MRNVPMDMLESGANIVNETVKYSLATAEYTGLVSLSYVKRGGGFIIDPIAKVTAPVIDASGKACKATAEGITTACKKTADGFEWAYKKTAGGLGWLVDAIPMPAPGKRVRDIEDRLHKIEDWMAYIDEKGFVMPAGQPSGAKPKKLTEEKEALLKTILLENMELMDM